MPAIGISDINGVYGLPRAFEAVRDIAPDIKLIHGAEVRIEDGPPIHLIVKDRRAWGFLCRVLTAVHAGKEKGKGQISLDEIQYLKDHFHGHDGLLCILKNAENNAFKKIKSIFPERVYLSLCQYLDGLDEEREDQALKLAKIYELPLVATNDVHYHDPCLSALQDVVTSIREGTTIDKAGFLLFGNEERYLKSPLQMEVLFAHLPESLSNTVKIADSCTFSMTDLKYTYPKESVPKGHTAKSYLRELVLKGVAWRYKNYVTEKIAAQVQRELDFFASRNEEDYFLTLYDILKEARDLGIVFQGRGSAASSIVCYALGFTAVDPISENLLFDRFANPERKDPPDIDIDFEHERREEVIQGVYRRYGRDRAAMVAAVHTYKDTGGYREVCKALGIPVGTKKAAEVKENFTALARDLAYRGYYIGTLTEQLKGSPRHMGTHSGGFVITNDPLIETVPVEPAAMDGRTIVQFDKHDLETLGMMKIDLLSIGFLTAIRKTCEMLLIHWEDIPLNDKLTYRLIQTANTAGCFQIESRAQMSSLPHTKPETRYEMTIQVALIRPSMSVGGMTRPYLKNKALAKQGQPFKSGNPAMDHILGRTHGISMFPDQIMQIAMDVCGFSVSAADQLRRSLGKERSAGSVQSEGHKLHAGLLSAGISKELADDILNRTQGFASYGFPEAHASSYGTLAFKSAYLKTHHPAEYLCGLLNSQPMGFYRPDFLINEAVRYSQVKILPINPNVSEWWCRMEGHKTVRLGFLSVRQIQEDAVLEMIEERKKAPFKSIEDFISRTDFSPAVIRHMAIAGIFEIFGLDRRHSFWKSISFQNLIGQKTSAQLSLFDHETRIESNQGTFKELTALEEAIIDYRLVGYSHQGNLMRPLRLELPHLPGLSSAMIKTLKDKKDIRFAGIVMVDQRPPPAKGFGFLTLEDEHGTIDLILKPDIYDKYKPVFRSSRFLIVEGRTQRIENQVTVKVKTLESFSVTSKIRSHQPTPRMLDRIEWS